MPSPSSKIRFWLLYAAAWLPLLAANIAIQLTESGNRLGNAVRGSIAFVAEEALEQFGDLLRYSLRVQQDTVDEVPLAEEWAFVSNYLELERLRLGDRLRLETEIEPEALDRRVPVFSIQPLVENAIGHAVAPRAGGGAVRISARLEGGELRVEVADDGPGADPEDLGRGNGVGLGIVRRRLEALSNGRARFDVETSPGNGFAVRLALPQDLPADGSASSRTTA